MNNDSITEVTTDSWFRRIGNALKGIIFGLILFIVAFPLLVWNEGRAIDRIKALKEGADSVIHIESSTIDPANNEKPVHLTGDVKTDDVLEDPEFNIEVNAIRLKREVQIYQWEEDVTTEKEKQLGGGEKNYKRIYLY